MYNYEWDRLKTWLEQYGALDNSINSPQEITRLDLSARSLKEIPDSIGILSKLLVLNLSNNRLTSLPESMQNLSSLKNLDIRRNNFELLPEFIASMHLVSLNASGNHLTNVEILQDCKELRVLDLSANGLGKLNNFLARYNELRTLNLSSNLIKDIRLFLPYLSHLERLNLSNNLLVEIPKEIEFLESIEELDFSSNQIEKIDNIFFDLEVEVVDLSANNLKELHLYSLESLEELILDENDFTHLSIEEYFAPYLREFSCDSCSLKEFLLPSSESMELLCYSSNNIVEVPTEISRYPKLKQLDIEANNIKELPDSLANLVYLQTFYAKGNPLSEKSKKIVEILSPNICDLNMKSGISVEFASAEDLGDMANLLSILFAIEKDFTFNYEKQFAGIKKLFEYEGSDMLVAKYESEVIGMVTMQRLISSAEGDYIGQIEDLVVKEAYRKMGVGSRLINKMRSVALEYGYKRIQLAADMDNTNALRFYNKRGFQKTNLNIYHYGV